MNDQFEFQDGDELLEALNGEMGPALQALAQRELHEAQVAEDQQMHAALTHEIQLAEQHAGRRLTTDEVNGIVNNIPADGIPEGFAEKEGQRLAERTHTSQGRDELAEEAAREAMEEGNEPEAEEEFVVEETEA